MTERMLNALNITTCQDLYDERALLHLLFSQISSHHFLRVCLGLGSTEVDKCVCVCVCVCVRVCMYIYYVYNFGYDTLVMHTVRNDPTT